MFTSLIGTVGWWLGMLACTATAWAAMRPRKSLTVVGLVFLCIFIQFLRGGFNLEGNMEEPLTEEAELWLAAVEAEQRAIEALPFVKSVGYTYGEIANNAKVLATVWCCWQPSRSSFKQVAVNLHLELRPTHLEALQELHQKLLRDHGGATHEPHAQAVIRRAELQQGGNGYEKSLVLARKRPNFLRRASGPAPRAPRRGGLK